MDFDCKISCPIFGGQRTPFACIQFDRYKTCRKNCASLEKFIAENPEAPKAAEDLYNRQRKKMTLPARFAGKGLPIFNRTLKCRTCSFMAKSMRGLKAHLTRTHGVDHKKRKRLR